MKSLTRQRRLQQAKRYITLRAKPLLARPLQGTAAHSWPHAGSLSHALMARIYGECTAQHSLLLLQKEAACTLLMHLVPATASVQQSGNLGKTLTQQMTPHWSCGAPVGRIAALPVYCSREGQVVIQISSRLHWKEGESSLPLHAPTQHREHLP